MLKSFRGLTFWDGALLFVSLFFGIIFRTLGLRETSAWLDEVASWYYALNLMEGMAHDSHTPFYYALCRIWGMVFSPSLSSLRYFTLVLSFGSLLFCFFYLLKEKRKQEGIILFILWNLWPTLIIYGRQARHYELFLDFSILFLVLWKDKKRIPKILFFGFLVSFLSIHPMSLIPFFFFILMDLKRGRISLKECFFYSLSSLPINLYYLYRFMIFGNEKVLSNISWIVKDFNSYFRELIFLFFGDSYPLNVFYPVSYSSMFFLSFCLIFIFYSKISKTFFLSESLVDFLLIFFLTILGVEVTGALGLNLRISRYYIYLVAFLFIFLLSLVKNWKEDQFPLRAGGLLLGLLCFSIFFQSPWASYAWDDEKARAFKELYPNFKDQKKVVICSNPLQVRYYFDRSHVKCRFEAMARFNTNETFVFFDFNNSYQDIGYYLLSYGKVENITRYGHAYSFHVLGKK